SPQRGTTRRAMLGAGAVAGLGLVAASTKSHPSREAGPLALPLRRYRGKGGSRREAGPALAVLGI
ncbi:hypothetical protein, partial [Crystallibacter crystallopoietes]|uniref:hypothetical protein n=1 Tax=Crystallibacter crystallopoietes TaxID=37928 RepID=UPI001ED9878C